MSLFPKHRTPAQLTPGDEDLDAVARDIGVFVVFILGAILVAVIWLLPW